MFGHVACPRVLTDQLLIFWYIYICSVTWPAHVYFLISCWCSDIYIFSHVACPRVYTDLKKDDKSRGRLLGSLTMWYFFFCARASTHSMASVQLFHFYLVGHTTKRHADRVASQERCKRNATRSPGLHRYEEQTRRMLSPRPRYWRPYPHLPPPPPAASPAVELSTVADSHRRDRHVMMTAADSLLVRRRPPRQLLPPPAIPLASRQTGPRLPRECHWRRKRGWPVSGTGTSRGCPPRRRECPARRGGPGRPRSPRAGVRCSRWSRPSRWKQVVSIP